MSDRGFSPESIADKQEAGAKRFDRRAIGIFDSGLGGLTVARAVRRAFPNEPICYLGDVARVPYGTKSPETVQLYARQSIAFLLSQKVKYIIAACNTVSAAALPFLQEKYDVPVLGVVEMGAEAALIHEPRRVGVIGTETTIASAAYICAIQRRAPEVEVVQKACPFFVPLIEELWLDDPITRLVIERYLAPMRDAEIDVLILGCTHYPLISEALGEYFGPKVRLVDSAEAMVMALRKAYDSGALLPACDALSNGKAGNGDCRYYVTDRGSRFQTLVEAFLGETNCRVQQISSEVLIDALASQK